MIECDPECPGSEFDLTCTDKFARQKIPSQGFTCIDGNFTPRRRELARSLVCRAQVPIDARTRRRMRLGAPHGAPHEGEAGQHAHEALRRRREQQVPSLAPAGESHSLPPSLGLSRSLSLSLSLSLSRRFGSKDLREGNPMIISHTVDGEERQESGRQPGGALMSLTSAIQASRLGLLWWDNNAGPGDRGGSRGRVGNGGTIPSRPQGVNRGRKR